MEFQRFRFDDDGNLWGVNGTRQEMIEGRRSSDDWGTIFVPYQTLYTGNGKRISALRLEGYQVTGVIMEISLDEVLPLQM